MKTCSKCGKEKEVTEFNKLYGGLRPSCKQCDKDGRDPYKDRLQRMAKHLLSRLSDTENPRNNCYIGVECKIGNSVTEIKEYLDKNFREEIKAIIKDGETPSLDRINPKGHYEEGNLRIISFRENYMAGLVNAMNVISKRVTVVYANGSRKSFDSISHASRELGLKRDTIIERLKTAEPLSSPRIKDKRLLGAKFLYTVR